MAADEHLNYNWLKDPRDLSPDIVVESIWFELSPPKTKKILIGAIYKRQIQMPLLSQKA